MNQPMRIDESIRFAEKVLELLDEGRFVAT
jgi:hypothetical protein